MIMPRKFRSDHVINSRENSDFIT